MRKIRFSPESLEDLQRIKASVLENFDDEEFAVKAVAKLLKQVDGLVDFPNMGMELTRILELPTDFLYLFRKPNYIFYRLEGEYIDIIRILNERQDYIRILFGIGEEEN